MVDASPHEDQIRALDEGRAFVDRSFLRKISVQGSDAGRWLNDLVTAGVGGLPVGRAVRSLFLSPTGRIRADVHVIRTAEGYLLLQDPAQPAPIDHLLAPYVLSSDVALADRTDSLAVLSLAGTESFPAAAMGCTPSTLGDGTDLVVPVSEHEELTGRLRGAGLREVGNGAVEARRIRRGIARFPIDLDEESLPAEAGLEVLIDFSKGCFLGQESVAKVRNLGHPPRVVLALRADGAATPGDPVMADGVEAGRITSAAPLPGGTALLARVRWEARSARLRTPAGSELTPA